MKICVRGSVLAVLAFLSVLCAYAGPLAGAKAAALWCCAVGGFVSALAFLRKIEITKITFGWGLLLLYVCLSGLMNFPQGLLYAAMFSACVVCMHVQLDERAYRLLWKLFTGVGVLLAVSVLLQKFFPGFFYAALQKWFFWGNQAEMVYLSGAVAKHYTGLFIEPSLTGFYLGIAFCLVYGKLFFSAQKSSFVWCVGRICLLGLFYYALWETQKRSMILAISFLSLLFGCAALVKKPTRTRICTAIAGGVVLVLCWSFLAEQISLLLTKGTAQQIELSAREPLWQLAWQMFRQSPFVGNGANSYDVAFNASGIRNYFFEFAGAHNGYLQLLAEWGLLGVLLFFPLLFRQVLKGVKNGLLRSEAPGQEWSFGALSGIAFIMIYALSGNPFHQPQELFTLFILLGVLKKYETIC